MGNKKLQKQSKKDSTPTILHKPKNMAVDEWRKENGIPDWTNHQSYRCGGTSNTEPH